LHVIWPGEQFKFGHSFRNTRGKDFASGGALRAWLEGKSEWLDLIFCVQFDQFCIKNAR